MQIYRSEEKRGEPEKREIERKEERETLRVVGILPNSKKDDRRFGIIEFFFTHQGQGNAAIRNHPSQRAYSDFFRRSKYHDRSRTPLDSLFFILEKNQ